LWDLDLRPEDEDAKTLTLWITMLKEIGADLVSLWDLDEVTLRGTIEHLANKRGSSTRGVDPRFVLYLAVEPPWSTGATDADPISRVALESRVATEAGALQGPAGEEITPDDEIRLLQINADIAEQRGDKQEATDLLRGILARAEASTSAALGAVVGNAAIRAERLELADVALGLYEESLRLDPGRILNILNYVDFLLDNDFADRYAEASELVDRARTLNPNERKEYRRLLELRIGKRVGSLSNEEILRDATSLLTEFEAGNPDLPLSMIAPALVDIGLPDMLEQACRIAASAQDSTPRDRYVALRVFTDSLVEGQPRLGADLYLYMLRSGLACLDQGSDLGTIKHNLATTLYSLDYDRTAALLWEEAYKSNPHELRIRRSLATALNTLHLPEAASSVLLGQLLPPLDLEADDLPDRFEPSVEAWWIDSRDANNQPCPSFISELT
jgi:tetratricopeptide (TPR) repeat protein